MLLKRLRKSAYRTAALFVVASTLAVACQSTTPTVAPATQATSPTQAPATTAPDTQAPQPTTPPTTAPEPTAEVTTAPGEPKIFKLSETADVIEGFNPFKANGGGTWEPLSRLIYSRLVQLDINYAAIPDLAESWTISPDGKEFAFTLRQGVKWHDGTPFTSKDVVATYQYLLNPATGANLFSNFQLIEGAVEYSNTVASSVSGISTSGDFEVTFKLKEPNALFMLNVAKQPIVQESALKGIAPADFAKSDAATTHPLPGTGPFMFKDHKVDESIDFDANPDYFRGRPKVDGVRAVIIPDTNTRIIAFENGEIDLLQGITIADIDRVTAISGATVLKTFSPGVGTFWINFWPAKNDAKSVAMRTPQFRQAIAYAFNYDDLIQVVTNNHPELAVRSYCHSAIPGNCASDLPKYDYDPDKAKALLAEIKWDPSWQLEMDTIGSEPVHPVMQQMLQEVGLNVQVTPLDVPTLIKKVYGDGDFDFVPAFYPDQGNPVWYYNVAMLCKDIYPDGYNGVRYCNPKFDEIVGKILTTPDPAANQALLQSATAILMQDLPILPTWNTAYPVAYGSRVAHFDFGDSYTWEDPQLWELK